MQFVVPADACVPPEWSTECIMAMARLQCQVIYSLKLPVFVTVDPR